jgi:hypothetical protein
VTVTVGQTTPGIDFSLPLRQAGDLNEDGVVNLADVLLALQITAGMPQSADLLADLDADGRIALAEAIYILQMVAGIR